MKRALLTLCLFAASAAQAAAATKYLYNPTGTLESANALSTSSGSQVNATYADGDTVVINAGNVLTVGADHSGDTTGMAGLTITGISSGTPGMLTFAATGTSVLKMASNTTIAGTNVAVRGRIMMGGGTWGSPAAIAFGTAKHGIVFGGTSTPAKIDATYLDLQLYCQWPTILSARTYGVLATVSSISGNTLTLAAWPTNGVSGFTGTTWANGAIVRLTSSGTYPTCTYDPAGNLRQNCDYYLTNVNAGNKTCQLTQYNGTPVLPLGTSWSGTLQLYDGAVNGATVLNVLDDVTGDASWSTTAGWNWCAFVDESCINGGRVDRTTMTGISSSQITLNNALSAAARAGSRVWLASRNVKLECPAGTSQSTPFLTLNAVGGSTVQCMIGNTGFLGNASCATGGYGVYNASTPSSSHTVKSLFFGLFGGFISNVDVLSNSIFLANNDGARTCTNAVLSSCTFAGNSNAINVDTGSNATNSLFIGNANAVNSSTGTNCTGSTFANNYAGVYGGQGNNVTSALFMSHNSNASLYYAGPVNANGATFLGSQNNAQNCTGCDLSNALIYGCGNGVYSSYGFNLHGATVQGDSSGISSCAGFDLGNASFTNNTRDVNLPQGTTVGYGATLGSSTQVLNYANATGYCDPNSNSGWQQICIYDYAGTPGNICAWMNGGTVKPAASGWTGSFPGSQSFCHRHQPVGITLATGIATTYAPCYVDIPLLARANVPLTVSVYLQKDGTGWQETPWCGLVDNAHAFNAAASFLGNGKQTMADTANSWQTLTCTYTPTADAQVRLRVSCKNANGNLWWNYSYTDGGTIVVDD